jgi:hypothetical protein
MPFRSDRDGWVFILMSSYVGSGPLKIVAHESRHVERDQTRPDYLMPEYGINIPSTRAIGVRMIRIERERSTRIIH